MEGLREETLDLTGAADRLFILLGEFLHAHDGDDILKLPVALQNALDGTGDLIVLLPDDLRREDAAGGIQGIDRRVDAEGGDGTIQNGGGIQMGEGGGGGGVGEVIGRDIDRLH